MKHTKQIFTTVLSVLVSVFLVAGVAFAVTTISGTTVTLENSATITNPSAGRVDIGGMTSSGGGRGLYLENIASGATVDLKGGMFTATGSSSAGSGTIKGLEAKARANPWGGPTGGTLGEIAGIYVNADTKGATVALLRGAELKLDTGSGGSVTKAVGLEINRYLLTAPTTSYAIEINPGSSGSPNWTADIVLQNDATISNATSGRIDLNAGLFITESGLAITDEGRQMYYQFTATSIASGKQLQGLQIKANWAGTVASANAGVTGAEIKARVDGTSISANLGELIAIKANADNKNNATTTEVRAVDAILEQNTGTITNAYGVRSWLNNSGTIGTKYAFYVDASNKSAATFRWDVGLAMSDNSVTTGIDIGDCTTGISIGSTTRGITAGGSLASWTPIQWVGDTEWIQIFLENLDTTPGNSGIVMSLINNASITNAAGNQDQITLELKNDIKASTAFAGDHLTTLRARIEFKALSTYTS